MTESHSTDHARDWTAPTLLVGAVALLLAFGLVMLTSASRVRAAVRYGDPLYLLVRQIGWLGISVVVALIVAHLDYRWYRKIAWLVLAVSVIGLLLVFVPGIGARRGGSSRWVIIAGFQFQPSEFAKLAMIIALAAWYANRSRAMTIIRGICVPLLMIGLIGVLLFLEPDYSTLALVAAVGGGIMFVSGVKWRHLLIPALAGILLFTIAVIHDQTRWQRVESLWDQEGNPAAAYQLQQAKEAFALGEWTGIGLGESIQKYRYLPEAHNDFIFAIIGEELGLVASGIVVLLFLMVLICGLRISVCAPDRFGRLLGTGLTLILSVQALVNVAVVTGCLPTTGITLPFISYGGSSLLVTMVMIGILLNIARQAGAPDDPPIREPRRNAGIIANRELSFADC